jgi:hypothetical protein
MTRVDTGTGELAINGGLNSFGLLAAVHFFALVPAIRCKSGAKPLRISSPGFSLLSGSLSTVFLFSSLE